MRGTARLDARALVREMIYRVLENWRGAWRARSADSHVRESRIGM